MLWMVLIIFVSVGISFGPFRSRIAEITIHSTAFAAEAFSNIGRGFANNFSFITSISNLKQQNEELATQIRNLEVDKSRITELENENEILKKELGFISINKDFELIPAKIIGREPTLFFDSITIDKGNTDQVKKGSPVISNGALVGQVAEVFEKEARVTLITSNNSIILAMLQTSRSKGILHGGISGLILENIIQDVAFNQDEFVVTSGLDGMRQGILIGKVGKIQSSSSDLFKNISVEPIADLPRLEIVFVMK